MHILLSIALLSFTAVIQGSCPVKTTVDKCCHLPFFYKGYPYYKCKKEGTKTWCAYHESYISGKWDYCKGTGVHPELSPLTQIEDEHTGYCLNYGNNGLETAPCKENSNSQKWAWYAFYQLKNIGSGLCLSVSSTKDALVMVPCDLSSSDGWDCGGDSYKNPSIKLRNQVNSKWMCLQVQKDFSVGLAECNTDIVGQQLKVHGTKSAWVCTVRDHAGSFTEDKNYYLLKSLYFQLSWPEKYVKVYMVFNQDSYQNYLSKYGDAVKAQAAIKHTAVESMSILDKAYRMIRVRILLVGYEVWSAGDKINVTTDYYVLKKEFREYSVNVLRKQHTYDTIVFVYGRSWSGSWSGAGMGDMCPKKIDNDYEVFVMAQRKGTSVNSLANLLSHEIGHQFDMGHSFEPSVPCPTYRLYGKFCTMGGNSWPKAFSADFLATIRYRKLTCLDAKPSQNSIIGCGNGIIDPGEECDCGSSEDCKKNNQCCDGSICKLRPGSQCSSEKCCTSCKFDETKTGCGGDIKTVTEPKRVIKETTVLYNRYQHWHIKVTPGKHVELVIHFKIFDWGVNCPYDYISVRDGGKSSKWMGKFCLPHSRKRIISTGNELFVTYHSDSSFRGEFEMYHQEKDSSNADCKYKTTTGECCYIPFTYRGVLYNGCSPKGEPRPWCSYSPNYEGAWGFCQQKPGTKVLPDTCTVMTEDNDCCHIPFNYKGTLYTSCKQSSSKTWCSKTLDYSGKWGYCKS